MNRNVKVVVNPKIKEILSSINVSVHDGLCYLFCVYYGIDPSYIPMELKQKILATRIVTKDYDTGEITWKVPLFEGQEIGFEWIDEFMNLFRDLNPARKGTKSMVLSRMKKFFMNNPSVRKEDVMEATKLYLKSVDNPEYLKLSHKFIQEKDGSMLEDWIETYENLKTNKSQKRRMM